MSNSAEANRGAEVYAHALVEAGDARANADTVQWRRSRDFSLDVLGILREVLEFGDSKLIDDMARKYLIDSIAKKYKDILDSKDEELVKVITAVPLDDELREKVRNKVAGDLGKPVYLVETVDPSILGGIILEVLGKRFDASVRAQLADIRKTLVSTYAGSEG